MFADLGGMLKLAHRTLQAAKDVTAKCNQIDLTAKKSAFVNLYDELTQLTGCKLGEEVQWHGVGFDANFEDIRGIIKVKFGHCDAAKLRDKRAEVVKLSSAWGERMKRAGHVDMPPELGAVKHLVAQLAKDSCLHAAAVPLQARR